MTAHDGGDESLAAADGDRSSTSERGRPPAPPPPPAPKRTIVTTSLQDDSADIGEEAPPSPADVRLDGAAMADLGGEPGGRGADMNGAEPREMAGEGGSDVFGSEAADDEDAALAGNFSAPPPVRMHGDEGPRSEAPPPLATPPSPSRPVASPAVGESGAALALDGLLADSGVGAIVVVPGAGVQVERGGKLEPAGQPLDANAVAEAVWQLANRAIPPPPSDNPVVDVRLLDGTRVTALFPPIASEAVVATIRKPGASEGSGLSDLAGSVDVDKILHAAVVGRRNLILAGDVAAQAALLAAVASALPADRRVVSVGFAGKPRPGWIELGPGNDPGGLVRAAVAFRADHLLCAEAGGAELPELLLAAARGQEGIVGCVGARSAAEALARLRAFSVEVFGAAGFASMVTSTVDLVVFAAAGAGGGVRVLEIAEPRSEGETLVPSFVARRSGSARGGSPEVSGVSERLAASIAAVAESLPSHLVRR